MGWLELLRKPVVAMIGFDTLFTVMTVLVKKALDGGLNPYCSYRSSAASRRSFPGTNYLLQRKECKTKIHKGDLCLLVHECTTWVMLLCSSGNPNWVMLQCYFGQVQWRRQFKRVL